MGAILEATPEMGEWSVEVRRESAYLTGSGYNELAFDGGPEPHHVPRVLWDEEEPFGRAEAPDEIVRAVAFAIPAEDASKVRAALDQVIANPSYVEFMRENPAPAGTWRVEQADGLVRLYGPVIAFGSHKPWALHPSVELEYSSLAELRAALVELA
ncbi:hypothetical protein G3I59_36705 [Amycolatopsis rubida]|uniref:Uncharacterized protein n=1 Tax=Amycolatopsis rubida TaxID=112413 RepID=A0ABX0BZY9_9PSEU|nr:MULTISPECIES: hypothetical protein [Amycolatopsis]MYW96000.1 hypothetical protein [Amycolatopsis rubida]NEC60991.1 hypothetical protein [Amycolatopsis rubida]OAP20567.1 hypothetical protein A4R44_08727 [Amycolatopsis sp. M39]